MKLYFSVLSTFLCMIVFSQRPIINTRSGKVAGYIENKIEVFKGIPFAAPPIGALRWKAPQPVTPWKDVKTCTSFSASPMQADPKPFMVWSKEYLIPGSPISEDCLYLNVWTANSKSKSKKPVFVYIYGGGFQSGGTACPIYDGVATAKKEVVFVSINYRVGIFAFLAHPELTKEAPYHSSGNYGLLDMIAGLKWVKENITAFGGDPDQVTIGGQSAGAFAVNFLCASPLAKGLFRGAIAESGGSILASSLRPSLKLADGEKIGIKFANDLHCANINALRNKSSEEIFKALGGLKSPIEDGYFLPTSISEIYETGKQNDVPLLMGWNQEDIVAGPPVSASNYIAQINKQYAEKANQLLAAYPATNDAIAAKSQKELSRDQAFAIQEYVWSATQLKTGKSPVYMYNFNRQLPGYTAETEYGAFHTAEVAFAYNNLKFVERPFTAVDHKLASRMSNYWANFIKTGNPNSKDLPVWNKYNTNENWVMVLDENAGSQPLPNKKQLETLLQLYK